MHKGLLLTVAPLCAALVFGQQPAPNPAQDLKNRARIQALKQRPQELTPSIEPAGPVLDVLQDLTGEMALQRGAMAFAQNGSLGGLRDFDRDRHYEGGKRALDHRDYERAIAEFEQVIANHESRADGALYWKAYAQNKLGRRDQAIATIGDLEKSYPSSSWLNDARALRVEIGQESGQPVSPESQSDEDLKLLALNSLARSDPDRAVPILEKLLKDPGTAPELKENALFVLAQAHSAQARALLAQFAKGASNPDIQIKAIRYLSVFNRGENAGLLVEVYNSTHDAAVKRAVLQGFMLSRDAPHLVTVAKTEQNADLRHEAIQYLGAMRAQTELEQLYNTESSPELKQAIINALFISRDSGKLLEIAKNATDPNVRGAAIERLGLIRDDDKIPAALASLYFSSSDKTVREKVINALFLERNAQALVAIARKETDPEMKKKIVERLGLMRNSKDATDYLMELLSK
jgi:tetratricopeptide (TPR) repeat protein